MSDDFIEMGEQIASDLDKIQQMVQKLLFELEDTPNLQKLRQVEDLIFSTRQK